MATHRNVRIEEIAPILLDVQASFLVPATLAKFVAFSGKRFGLAFQTSFAANIVLVQGVVSSFFFIKECKLLRINLYSIANGLRPQLDLLQPYVDFAGPNLTVLPADFGIHEVREQIAIKNMEGIVAALKVVNTNIAANITALTVPPAGEDMPLSMQTDFVTAQTQIETLSNDHKTKIKAKETAVQANTQLFNTVWDQFNSILKVGKALFKSTDKEKTREFTLEVLKSRVRRAVHKTIADDIGSTVTLGEYSPVIPAGVVFQAGFQVKPTDKILCSDTGNTSEGAFFSKVPNLTAVPGDAVITHFEPGDEEVLTPAYHPDPDTIYLYIVNFDKTNDGEMTIDLVD